MGVLNGSKGHGDNGGLFSTHTAVLSKSCAVVFIQKIVTLFFRVFLKNTMHISRKQSQWILLLIKGELVVFLRDPPQKPLGIRKSTELKLMAHGLRASHHIWTGNLRHKPRDSSSSDTQQTFQLRRKVSVHLPSTAFCEDGFPFHLLERLGVE